jgi:hypothetical protein
MEIGARLQNKKKKKNFKRKSGKQWASSQFNESPGLFLPISNLGSVLSDRGFL